MYEVFYLKSGDDVLVCYSSDSAERAIRTAMEHSNSSNNKREFLNRAISRGKPVAGAAVILTGSPNAVNSCKNAVRDLVIRGRESKEHFAHLGDTSNFRKLDLSCWIKKEPDVPKPIKTTHTVDALWFVVESTLGMIRSDIDRSAAVPADAVVDLVTFLSKHPYFKEHL